jgi:hypothetical protein
MLFFEIRVIAHLRNNLFTLWFDKRSFFISTQNNVLQEIQDLLIPMNVNSLFHGKEKTLTTQQHKTSILNEFILKHLQVHALNLINNFLLTLSTSAIRCFRWALNDARET